MPPFRHLAFLVLLADPFTALHTTFSPRHKSARLFQLHNGGRQRSKLGFSPFPVELVDISAFPPDGLDASGESALSFLGDQLIDASLSGATSPLSSAADFAHHQHLLDEAGTLLTAFSDQKGTLAGTFFQGSLPPYLAFLYFLGFEGNRTPKLTQFGFSFLLLFVAATIPTGIISKSAFGLTLADVDWLHGSAEFLLTVSNVLVVLGLREALLGDAEGGAIRGREDGDEYNDARQRYGALAIAGLVAAFCASGVGTLGLDAHTPFLGGAGALPQELVASFNAPHAEPANALSMPTWAVHFSSVFEFLFAMKLVGRYAEATGKEEWKGLAWGMLPSHASGIAACTYHLFYNAKSVGYLVTLQAFLTCLGNLTLAIATARIALANGWTFGYALGQLDPRKLFDESLRDPSVLPPPPSSESASSSDQGNGGDVVSATSSTTNPLDDFLKGFPNPLSQLTGGGGAAAAAAEAAAAEAAAAAQAAAAAKAASFQARTADVESKPLLAAKLIGATVLASYAVKYGELYFDLPFEASPLAAFGVFALPPALTAASLLSSSPDLLAKLPGGGSEGGNSEGGRMMSLSMDDVKKFGVSGTIAYVLTELAFWAVAFPAASYAFYSTAGHWPDIAASNADRAALLGFVFGAANVARLAVPLRFGAALALAPWVDENIVSKFGGGSTEASEE